jgi:hypothetical protein
MAGTRRRKSDYRLNGPKAIGGIGCIKTTTIEATQSAAIPTTSAQKPIFPHDIGAL